jgi:ribosomal protein S18 acetylase RimI-like enzyme
MVQMPLKIRRATDQDRQPLANLIHFETHVHRHLDWRPPLDWIHSQPYLVGECQGGVCFALVCPPDPPQVAWIRLFAVAHSISVAQAWQVAWPVALAELSSLHQPEIAAMANEGWFRQVLAQSGFCHSQNIVTLVWHGGSRLPQPASFAIRLMMVDDLTSVCALDAAAFAPLWRNSAQALAVAFRQAALATVVEAAGDLIGYQISTASAVGGHLARLAVHPAWQGRGVGYALVYDVLRHFSAQGARHISVNTQDNNYASLSLYQKTGFVLTDEAIPVYQLN